MKRKILCFLITSLLILNTVPVFASSDSGQTAISLENIKEVMLDNSIEMKIAENNYKQTLNVVNLRKYRKFNKKHLTIGKKMQPRYRY